MSDQVRLDLAAVSQILRDATLECSDLDDTLRLMRLYARLHWDNISGFFADEPLEQSVFDTWSGQVDTTPGQSEPSVDVLHVATELYNHGGHSRLLRKIMANLSSRGTQSLILTQHRRRNDISNLPIVPICLTGTPKTRLSRLVKLGARAKTIFLHIHPDDSIAVLAARILRENGKKVLFVNHADHVFSLGPGAGDVVLDICMTGWRTTSERRAARAQSFMGIPIVDAKESAPVWEQNRSGPIVSMGGPGKFKPTSDLDFPAFLMRILPRINNDAILIGPSSKDPWWAEAVAAFPGRIHLMGTQPPEQVAKIMASAGCYVDSFPLDGGTAYPQTAMMGVPCFGPNAQAAPGVSPTDELRFKTVAAMEEAIVAFLEGADYPFDLEGVRERIAVDFSTNAVLARIASAMRGDPCPPLDYLEQVGQRSSDYNADRWAADGVVHIPKRQWRGLSLRERARLIRRVRANPLPDAIAKQMILRILTNWV